MFNETKLLKNYAHVIEESALDINNNGNELLENIVDVLSSPTGYMNFKQDLMEGLFESSDEMLRDHISALMDRQQSVIITESTTVMASPEAMSFAVASFPMLIDLYADPLLSKAITVYPYDKPMLTIPRIKWIATIVDEKGVGTDYEYPTATKSIRANVKNTVVSQNDNLFTRMGIDSTDFRISQRNARITKASVEVDDGAGNVVAKDIDLFGIFDAKGNFFVDDLEIDGKTFRIQGTCTFANGRIVWSSADISTTTSSVIVTFKTINVQFKIYGNGIAKAVVKTKPLMSTIEVNCDIEESFEITDIEEVLQDWKALWNLDVLSILKDHVKDQMKLNKDAEIADLLYGNIPAAKKYKLYREFDAASYFTSGEIKPTTIMDIFKNIYPIFIDLVDQMRKRIKMEPKYIICGTKAGSVLKSLQSFETSLVGNSGELGQTRGNPSVNKFEIIVSDAVEEDLIHMVVKNEDYKLATILEVTYKPLYVIVETTNSKKRTFIKSRGWIGIVRNEGIATIKLSEATVTNYFGNV